MPGSIRWLLGGAITPAFMAHDEDAEDAPSMKPSPQDGFDATGLDRLLA